MNRKAFWERAMASGWIDVDELRPAISGIDREIALKAIAERATGSPAEAARQILAGIAVLNAGAKKPVVVLWTEELQSFGAELDRAAWHESERDRLIAKAASDKKTAEEFWSRSPLNPDRRATQYPSEGQQASDPQTLSESLQHPVQKAAASEFLDEESQEAGPHPSAAPRREASDES